LKILLICHKIPYPLFDGGSYSTYNTALGLISQKIDLKILAVNTSRDYVDLECIPNDFRKLTRFETTGVDTRLKPMNAFLNLFSNHSYLVERFFSKEYNTHLIEILKDAEFDIIQLEHLYLCLYLETIRKYSKAKVVLRPQNVENMLWHDYLNKLKNPFSKFLLLIATRRLEVFEKKMINKVDGLIALTSIDADYFKKFGKQTKIIDVPIGIDFTRFENIDFDKQFENFPVLYHLGSMDWKPNVEGLKWFVKKVMPILKQKYPEIKIKIAGKNMPKWFFKQKNKNLIVEGRVVDSIKYQEDKAILIVPLITGGGIRVKILEGLAMGKTIISTTIGAQGISVVNNENILIADSPEAFVSQISKCIESETLCRIIGYNAKKLAIQKYELSNIAKGMIEFYKSL